MPIYEYRCRSCEHEFEELLLRAADAAEVVCPRCAAEKPERVLSASAAVVAGGGSRSASCDTGGG